MANPIYNPGYLGTLYLGTDGFYTDTAIQDPILYKSKYTQKNTVHTGKYVKKNTAYTDKYPTV